MKETIAQFLKIQTFPFRIKDENGNEIYYENSDGYWCKREYNNEGHEIYSKESNRRWVKREYDDQGNTIYYENSDGFWEKREYDDPGNTIYYENSLRYIIDNRPKSVVEMTLQEIADKLGMDVKSIRIKD
jgi:hypothetical protein